MKRMILNKKQQSWRSQESLYAGFNVAPAYSRFHVNLRRRISADCFVSVLGSQPGNLAHELEGEELHISFNIVKERKTKFQLFFLLSPGVPFRLILESRISTKRIMHRHPPPLLPSWFGDPRFGVLASLTRPFHLTVLHDKHSSIGRI